MEWFRENNPPPLNQDPFDPNHHYDFVSAYLAGKERNKGEGGHFTSEFKLPTHPHRYPEEIGGIDSLTGLNPRNPSLGMATPFIEKTQMDRYELLKSLMQSLGGR